MDHAPRIFESFSSDPEVTRYLKWSPAESRSPETMKGRLARLSEGTELSWIPVLKSDEAVVGSVSLMPEGRQAELGFAFARRIWGQGVASEACSAVIQWAFSNGGFGRIWAACDIDNRRSQRVLEKLGMRHEREAPAYAVHPALGSEPRACHIYALDSPAT